MTATALSPDDIAVICEIPVLCVVTPDDPITTVYELGSPQKYTTTGLPVVNWSDPANINVDAIRGMTSACIIASADVVAAITARRISHEG